MLAPQRLQVRIDLGYRADRVCYLLLNDLVVLYDLPVDHLQVVRVGLLHPLQQPELLPHLPKRPQHPVPSRQHDVLQFLHAPHRHIHDAALLFGPFEGDLQLLEEGLLLLGLQLDLEGFIDEVGLVFGELIGSSVEDE